MSSQNTSYHQKLFPTSHNCLWTAKTGSSAAGTFSYSRKSRSYRLQHNYLTVPKLPSATKLHYSVPTNNKKNSRTPQKQASGQKHALHTKTASTIKGFLDLSHQLHAPRSQDRQPRRVISAFGRFAAHSASPDQPVHTPARYMSCYSQPLRFQVRSQVHHTGQQPCYEALVEERGKTMHLVCGKLGMGTRIVSQAHRNIIILNCCTPITMTGSAHRRTSGATVPDSQFCLLV